MTRLRALSLSAPVAIGLGALGYAGGAGHAATRSITSEHAVAASRITVKLSEYKFVPRRVTVRRGDSIVARNFGKLPHNLTIEKGPNPRKRTRKLAGTPTFRPRQTRTLKVTLRRGSYALVCTVPGHRQLGMVGYLTVR
jgi:plastocyanin